MGRSESLSKKKSMISEKKGTGSTFLNRAQKEVANEMVVTLTYLRPNLVEWNKDVVFSLQWMRDEKESQPTKIETTSDHLTGATIPMDLKFSFPIASSLSPSYLTVLINNPVIVNAYESPAQKSNSKGVNRSTGETLGQTSLDILPLFTQSGKTDPGSGLHTSVEDTTVTNVSEVKSDEPLKEAERAEEKPVVKILSGEFHKELTLQAMDMPRGPDLSTPMNKVNIGLTARLYLEAPIPGPNNILTITPESVYNLPPALSELQNMSNCGFSLGLSIPISSADSTESFESLSTKAASSLGPADADQEPPLDQTVTMVTFLNGHPESQPDLTYRSKWKLLEDQLSGPAKYTSMRLSKHMDDVKYGESVSHGATSKTHVQFNQTYRLWLSGVSEGLVREHIGAFGQWPLEILIEANRSTLTAESKKAAGGAGKSQASHGGKSKIMIDLPLPMLLLGFLDLTDLLLPGLTLTRVLAEFPPDLPSLRLLQLRTGFTQFVFPGPDLATGSLKSLETAHQSNSVKSPRSYYDKRDKNDTKKDDTTTETLPDQFHINPMAIVVRIELFRPLTEKPEQDATVHDLVHVIRSKHLYLPDLKREEAENVRESFERALARCTEIFYAEYSDYEKLRSIGDKNTSRQLVQNGEKTSDNIESNEEAQSFDTKILSDRHQKISNQKPKHQTGKTHINGDQLLNGKTAKLQDSQKSTGKSSITDNTNEPVQPLESSSKSPIKFLIPDDFKKYISQSGALTKCYTILARPLRDYVRSQYAMDGGDEYSVEMLSEIHAALLAVMSEVVNKVACSSIQPSSENSEGVEGCGAFQGITDELKKETSTRAHSTSSILPIVYEYSAQKYTCDAQRLLLSRIRDHPREGTLRNSAPDHSLDGTVWSSHAQWSLRYGNQEEAEESLKQSLYLGLERNELMMMAYISYLKKDWEKTDLYFTSLSYLFDNDIIAWMTMLAYYLNLGRTREAATALHMAKVCLATEMHPGGSEEETVVEKVRPHKNGGRKHNSDNQTDSKHYSSYKPTLKTESTSLTTLLSNELSWMIPRQGSFGDDTCDNSVYLIACPVFLALNMFEFADTCIVEYELGQSTASHLASYYKAVSQYKQGRYHQSMSHLNTIPTPMSQCVPALVLKFHNAYCVRREAKQQADEEERSMKSSITSDVSLSKSPSSTDCRRIYTSMSKGLEKPEYHSLRFLVLLRLGEIASSTAHAHLMGNDPKLIVSDRKLMNNDTKQINSDGKCANANRSKLADGSSKQLDNSSRQLDGSRRQLDGSRRQLDGSRRQSDDASTQLDDSSREFDDSESQILSEAEQHLLTLAREHDSPLVWYYLGLIYLKQNRLGESELALNEANKLDPALGNPWAGLARVNFAQRRARLFVSCRDEARKYNADPALIEVLDMMAALMT